MNKKKIIVALDSDNISSSQSLVKSLKNDAYAFKLGYEFFLNFGQEGYKLIQEEGVKIFLDLKLHDIPNTVKNGIIAISKLNPYFTTIHITGGDKMLKEAILVKKNIKIIGVSILTSLNSIQIKKYYNDANLEKIVSNLIKSAINNNLDGIVCSPKEIKLVKKLSSKKFIIITPGIRPNNFLNINEDQKRFMTPKEAIDLGSDFLVIGRPITTSSDPLEELKQINHSIE